MKKIFTIATIILLSVAAGKLSAQTFQVQADTVYITVPAGLSGTNIIKDTIAVSSGSITLQWKAIATNFPADWLAGTGICDDSNCYSSGLLWPSETVKTSKPYSDSMSAFDMQIDLDAATSLGTYFYRVHMVNQGNTSDTADETYIVTRLHGTSVPQLPAPSASDVLLYPNPASNEINLVYDPGMDIKNVAIYNIIGKVMSVYKVAGNSANLSLDNMPDGIYFVRMANSQGVVVATKRFTKQ